MSSPRQSARRQRATTKPRTPLVSDQIDEDLTVPWKIAAAIYFTISLIYFAPAFMPDRSIFGTDYFAGGYQFYAFIDQTFKSGHIPRWVPWVYGGLPLHANPGSTYYPIHFFLSLILPTPRVLPAVFVFQFAIGGIGMYLLASELRTRSWIAFLTGLAFQFTGITMAGVYSGHDGRIIVATFAPLVFFLLHRGMRTGSWAAFIGLGATIGFAMLSFQVQSAYYLLLAAGGWTIFLAFRFREATWGVVGVRMGKALLAVAFAFALAAVNFLPFQDYVSESPRGAVGGRGYEYATSFSMPKAEIAGLAIPEQQGFLQTYHGKSFFKQHTEYVGAMVMGLLLLGIVFSRRNKYWIFFGGVVFVALTFSLGGNTPIYKLYFNFLPGTTKFRAPSISFFLVSMSLVIMAALTLETIAQLRDGAPDEERAARRSAKTAAGGSAGNFIQYGAIALMAIAVLMIVMSQAIPSPYGEATGWIRFGLFLGIVGLLLSRWLRGGLQTRTFAIALSVVTLADLWIIDRHFFQTVPPPDQVYSSDDVLQYLQSQKDDGRVWVFPFGNQAVYHGFDRVGANTIPLRNYLMTFGVEQAGGEHGNQLQRWNEYAGGGEKVYVDWHNFTNSPVFMSAANIRYVISGLDLRMNNSDTASTAMGLKEVYRGPTAIVYRNDQALERAYLVPNVQVIPQTDSALNFMRSPAFNPHVVAVVDRPIGTTLPTTPLIHSSSIKEKTSDKVVVHTSANRGALLVLADVYAKGWHAWIDNKPAPIIITNVAFRGVVVPQGEHDVRFEFVPDALFRGMWISGILFLLLVAYGIWFVVSQRRAEPAELEAA
ncbi:MAG TPA: YfhO family protein [Gemmatimonadaceae bacterium]|nr:YfhO family protein [Gemmatimonadaceae bacterium]